MIPGGTAPEAGGPATRAAEAEHRRSFRSLVQSGTPNRWNRSTTSGSESSAHQRNGCEPEVRILTSRIIECIEEGPREVWSAMHKERFHRASAETRERRLINFGGLAHLGGPSSR